MKSTTATALILGLIMLLLVMFAAFIFLFQGRNTLEEQRDSAQMEATELQDSLAQANVNLNNVSATRTAVEDNLATAVSDNILFDGQLVQLQQELDALTAQMQNSEAGIASLTAQAPIVGILSPADGATIPVNEVNEIEIVAADVQGITAVNVLMNGNPLQEFAAGDVTLFNETVLWEPPESGIYEIGVMAVNVNGIPSETVTVTVQANQIQTSPASSLPDPNAALRAEIETAVSEIRGLEATEPITTTLLTPEELRQRVETDLLDEYTMADADTDLLVLSSFDFLARDFPLYDFTLDLHAEQIAGFYDPMTNEFVVVSDDDTLDALEQTTYAHEYMHALQDQHYNLDLLNDDTLNADATLALRALAEGEATYVQSQYANSGAVSVSEILTASSEIDLPILDEAPSVFSESLLFPYMTGSQFVTALHDQGGFDAVAYAWGNIPQSTEQIIHPDRFLGDDFPQEVTIPPLTDTLGADWVLVDQDVMGEAMLRFYLKQQLNEDQVETAATGWGGDQYAVYQNTETDELVMVLRQVWDTEDDSIEFAALYPNYPSRLFDAESIIQPNGSECWYSEDELICLSQNDLETLIVRAPTQEIVEAITDEIQ